MKKVIMKVNGCSHQFIVEPDRVLLDLLREDLRLTGAKQSCEGFSLRGRFLHWYKKLSA